MLPPSSSGGVPKSVEPSMEAAAELADYLPLSFKTPKEQEYNEFLSDALETNHTHGTRFLTYDR